MNKISDITRQDIIDIIKDGFVEYYNDGFSDIETEKQIYMPYNGRLDEIDFFARIYDLQSLPSYDHRYENAYYDIKCHLGWGDYDDYWFFQDRRFQLLQSDGDEPLLRFICEMLHPAVRNEKSSWKLYLKKFNEILREDGYELYPAQHISGRDIYKARAFAIQDKQLLPDNLFSERYRELISYGNGETVDNISGTIDFNTKKRLCKVMIEFYEPVSIKRDRYSDWTDNSTALDEAIKCVNEHLEMPIFNFSMAPFSPCSTEDLLAGHFTPYLFDVIEYQFEELSNGEKTPFQSEINDVFRKANISFRLSDRGLIELQDDYEVLSSEIINSIEKIKEPGVRDLLKEAIEKHMQPNVQAHRDAVEKLWDALERLKTYYVEMDKKSSVTKIVKNMSDGNDCFSKLFNAEFKALTDIGNDYRIRHHETDKIEISDVRYYDYFFNRCLSLIALAIQYL